MLLKVFTELNGKKIVMGDDPYNENFIYGKRYSRIKSGELIPGPSGPTIYINSNLITSIQNMALVGEPDIQRIRTDFNGGFKEVSGIMFHKVRDDHESNYYESSSEHMVWKYCEIETLDSGITGLSIYYLPGWWSEDLTNTPVNGGIALL